MRILFMAFASVALGAASLGSRPVRTAAPDCVSDTSDSALASELQALALQ